MEHPAWAECKKECKKDGCKKVAIGGGFRTGRRCRGRVGQQGDDKGQGQPGSEGGREVPWTRRRSRDGVLHDVFPVGRSPVPGL